MYVLCLTGTLAVFYPELERWEQPAVVESTGYDPGVLDAAFNRFLADEARLTPHMSLYLPTADFPRTRVANETAAWLIDSEGNLAEREHHPLTHLLTDVHLYLTLPESWGMILVSSLGALLLGLIVSGLLAHPRLVRDAFLLRWGRGDRLEHVDLHNRLSVWGTPFFLLIAITGTWFGLVLPLVGGATALTGEARETIVASVFGEEPAASGAGPVRLARALATLKELAPEAEPISATVHEADQPDRFLEISARHPERLIWSENYRFAGDGRYLGKVGFSDGGFGRQVAYSMYRLHFGHFDGLRSKLLYLGLGLALTVVSATGVNIWLARRNRRDALDLAWPALVWGFPLALTLCALLLLGGISAGPVALWTFTLAALAAALAAGDTQRARRWLRAALALACSALAAAHAMRHGVDALRGAALGINGALLLLAGVLVFARSGAPRKPARAAEALSTVSPTRGANR
jgi:uncharacterized iron-regulated membrane protein